MIRTSPFTCESLVMPLRDGTPVLVRAVGPEDKIRLQDGLSRMSTWSIYRRFARTVSRLTADELRYLTEVDQQNHIAWRAVDPSDPHETGLGISRLIRDPYCPTRAEVAVAVVDEYQQLGLGTILLAALYALAHARGIETLRAVVLPDNHVVLAWLLRLAHAARRMERKPHSTCSRATLFPPTARLGGFRMSWSKSNPPGRETGGTRRRDGEDRPVPGAGLRQTVARNAWMGAPSRPFTHHPDCRLGS